jgi:hypothetical protein
MQAPEKKTVVLYVRIPASLDARLTELQATYDVPRVTIVNRALEYWLANMVDRPGS